MQYFIRYWRFSRIFHFLLSKKTMLTLKLVWLYASGGCIVAVARIVSAIAKKIKEIVSKTTSIPFLVICDKTAELCCATWIYTRYTIYRVSTKFYPIFFPELFNTWKKRNKRIYLFYYFERLVLTEEKFYNEFTYILQTEPGSSDLLSFNSNGK